MEFQAVLSVQRDDQRFHFSKITEGWERRDSSVCGVCDS